MNAVLYYFWLAEQAFGGLILLWPLTIAILLLLSLATVRAVLRKQFTRANVAWALLPAIVPAVILAWGVVFVSSSPSGAEATWQAHAIYALFALQFVIAGIAIWQARAARLLTVATSLFIALFALSSAFVSGMSVTGDWL